MPIGLAILGALLAVAFLLDLGHRKIPNSLILSVAAVGLVRQALLGPRAILGGVVACLVVGALLWGSWSSRRLGGADLKLAAATSLSLELAQLPRFLLAGALAGGVLSLACYFLSARSARAEMRSNLVHAAVSGGLALPRAGPARVTVPYAGAIAAGALAAFGWGGPP